MTMPNILSVIERYTALAIKDHQRAKNEIHCPCPRCGGDDRFEITVDKSMFRCRDHCDATGGAGGPIQFVMWWKECGYNDACKDLGLDGYADATLKKHVSKADLHRTPAQPVKAVAALDEPPPSRTTALTLATYAAAHGVPGWVLEMQGWKDVVCEGRPAIEIPSADGNPRIRFLDAKGYRRKEAGKGEVCWYAYPGTRSGEKIADYIVLCNGQISAEAGRYVGLQSFSITDGEKALPKKLEDELKDLLRNNPDTTLVIALDADDAGRNASEKIAEQMAGHNVATVDFGGNGGYDLADFVRQHDTDSRAELLKLIRKPHTAIMDGAAIADALLDELESPTVIRPGALSEYLPIPWKSLHRFGGFASVLYPGKIAMIMAPSGFGKTSLLESWVDEWLKGGYDIVWWGSEWTETEYTIRRIQRYGGMTMNDYALHQIWKTETALAGASPNGRPLPEALRVKSIAKLKEVRGWPGNIWYLPPAAYVEESQEQGKALLHLLRRKGRRVGGFVWDYLQLMRSSEGDSAGNRHETTLDSIKRFAAETQTVNVIGSQVNKDVTKILETDKSFRLTAADAHYAREDKVNLLLGIEPQFKKVTEMGVEDTVFANWARLRVLKNSTGDKAVGGMGYIPIRANFQFLSWEPIERKP